MTEFQTKVKQIRELIAKGEIKAATDCLNEAWNLAGQTRAKRDDCHGLGNEIQRAICNEYLAVNYSGEQA